MNDTPKPSLSKGEFIAMIATMFATIAFSIDAMLPALPEIGASLSPQDVNRAQLVVTAFVAGMGFGTFFTGPLSDAYGRKPIIIYGSVLYCMGALLSYFSQSLETLVISRVLMGLGAAAPRVVAIAIVRDLFVGRDMARIMSFVMMIFTVFPAFAPLIGTGVIALSDWRTIFLVFALFSVISMVWLSLRLKEPLAQENRRPFRLPQLMAALAEMIAHPTVRLTILAQIFCMAMLINMIILVQPVYDIVFDRSDSFPVWFMMIALFSSSASFINAKFVGSIGMRRMVSLALGGQVIMSALMLMISLSNIPEPYDFYAFIVWQASVFFIVGLTIGNLNAIGMEPLGHIAGMAASVMGGISTLFAAAIAAPVGLLFDGTILPLVCGVLTTAALSYLTVVWMARQERKVSV